MNLTLGISPCPNDTFIFGAMALGLIDTAPFNIDIHYADVEVLNQWAGEGRLDATKLSFNAFADVTITYQLLPVGSALGRSCGPLLISLSADTKIDCRNLMVAVPGAKTTANFLLDFYGQVESKKYMRFDQIEAAIHEGVVDAGVIIHENRFTYAERGLHKIIDLGDHWETKTGHPIPLGGIVVKRGLEPEHKQGLNDIIGRSLAYAHKHVDHIMPYIREHAQEMEDQVMQQHIALYVNEFTKRLGPVGEAAVARFLEELSLHRAINLVQPWLLKAD